MRRDWLLAGLFAGGVAVGGWLAGLVQEAPRGLDAGGFALMGVAALSLGWRRSRPVLPLVGAVGGSSVYLLLGYPFGPVLLTLVWAMFEYARRRPLRSSAVALGVSAVVAGLAVLPRVGGHVELLAFGLVLWGVWWLAVPWSLGALVYVRRLALERERREIVRVALLEERIRVSREVHDVAGHGFAVVAMQAGAALVVLDEQPQQAREALTAIRDTSRAALDELRAVIENIDAPADIAKLVEQARAGGVVVELQYDGLGEASERQRRIAFEVVRESLTNVVKHSPGAGARVSVRMVGADVAVLVSNGADPHRQDGPGPHRTDDPGPYRVGGPGRGIEGMRDRVESAGGVFEVRVDGGFAVQARVPR
ncbi:sensor histidine kinase [Dactylosporangium matsuzakiense]|uniref:histidine kinase n=1 Tax=Dactylosporangium matsuzakiense TaxID=53360 RepID=A0A9W6KIK5_9ACTN|nr:histidine kinase [Dactylosporangium matsuzakiense]UWZ46074.1 sensor histidine kinase [Dactylosporangium matsuzakiense]GLL00204.1 two-component sensor histidine kinase [Dactylosporangium matsuzakiense]